MKKRSGGRIERLTPVEALLRRVMPPQFEGRVKLDKAAENWERVVGPLLARQSALLDLADGELLVSAETPLVGSRLSMMGGNIARALAEQWGIEVKKVKVVVGRAPLKRVSSARNAPKPPVVRVGEEEVEELKRRYVRESPELPEDAAESLARLRAFFAKRFSK